MLLLLFESEIGVKLYIIITEPSITLNISQPFEFFAGVLTLNNGFDT